MYHGLYLVGDSSDMDPELDLVNNGSGMSHRLYVVGEGSDIGPGIYPEDDRSSIGVLNSTCWMMALEQALASAKWTLSGMGPGLYLVSDGSGIRPGCYLGMTALLWALGSTW
jgi:hypothetical protein